MGCLGCIPLHHSWQNKSFHKVFTTCPVSSPQEIQPSSLPKAMAGAVFAAPLSQITPALPGKHSATELEKQHSKFGRQRCSFLLTWARTAAKSLDILHIAACNCNLLSSSTLKPQLGLRLCCRSDGFAFETSVSKGTWQNPCQWLYLTLYRSCFIQPP